MISFENVTFGYNDTPVLQDVSFSMETGKSLVIMGPSGSGKSTLLRLLLGLNCPQKGYVRINGENICGMKEKRLQEIRKGIGMVFQDGALFDSMTIGENIGFYLFEHTNMPEKEIESKAREMLTYVDLDPEIIDKLPEELSGGMRRRVAIARTVISTNPRLMLFDEPTTGLDPQSAENVLTLIKKLQDVEKISVIIVTHQISDALKLADQFVVIVDGYLVFDGNFDQLRECRTPQVVEFLAPFRESVDDIVKRQFI